MNVKRTLPPLNMKQTSVLSGIFSPPDALKELQQQTSFFNCNRFNKLNSIAQNRNQSSSKSPIRLITSSMSPMLQMQAPASCKKIVMGTSQLPTTINASSPGLQIISPYMNNSSVNRATGSKRTIFNFKNINQVPIAAHATTHTAPLIGLSPCKQQSGMAMQARSSGSAGSSGSIALALQHRLINRRVEKQQRKIDNVLIKKFMKTISSGSISQPSPPKVEQEMQQKISVHQMTKSQDDVSDQKSQDDITESDRNMVEGLKADLERKISGNKRGRKSRAISDYCEHTETRIKELKAQLEDPDTDETKKPKIRNQISAFQARMKAKIQNMGQEIQMRKVQDQIAGIMQIASQFIPADQQNIFQSKCKLNFPELKF